MSPAMGELLDSVDPPTAEAVRFLRSAEVFEEEAISGDGHLSDGVRNFRVVRRSPWATVLTGVFWRLSRAAPGSR